MSYENIKNSFLNLMLHSRHCQHHYHLWFVLTLKLSALTVAQEYSSTVRYVGPVTVICIWNKPCLVSGWFTDLKWMEADPPHEQRYACHTKTVFTLGSIVMLEAHPDISSKHRTLHFSLWAVCIVMCVQPWTCMCVIFLYVCSAFYVHVHQDVDLPVS